MSYVQSERAILYSLHRGACSRGLQAGREREIVPGLYVEWCGLLEMLISGNVEECAYYRVLHVACTCVCVSMCLEAALVAPFYSRREAREWYMDLLRGVL